MFSVDHRDASPFPTHSPGSLNLECATAAGIILCLMGCSIILMFNKVPLFRTE